MERINNPGSYWYKRALEANMETPSMRLPAVWIVSLPPTMNRSGGPLESMKVKYAPDMTDREFLMIFDNEVLVQQKRMLEMYWKAGRQFPTDLKDTLKEWRMRSAMELKLVELETHPRTGDEGTGCRTGLVTVSIDWKEVYRDWEYAEKLSYVNASKDPLKIQWSVGYPVKNIDEYKRALVLHQKLMFQRHDQLRPQEKSPFKHVFTIPHDLPAVGMTSGKEKEAGSSNSP